MKVLVMDRTIENNQLGREEDNNNWKDHPLDAAAPSHCYLMPTLWGVALLLPTTDNLLLELSFARLASISCCQPTWFSASHLCCYTFASLQLAALILCYCSCCKLSFCCPFGFIFELYEMSVMDCRRFSLALVTSPSPASNWSCAYPGIWRLVAMKPVGLVFGFGGFFFFFKFVLSFYLCKNWNYN